MKRKTRKPDKRLYTMKIEALVTKNMKAAIRTAAKAWEKKEGEIIRIAIGDWLRKQSYLPAPGQESAV
jgi:hypothetical protein